MSSSSQSTLDAVGRSLRHLPLPWLRAGGLFFFAMAVIFAVLTVALLGGVVLLHWEFLPDGLVAFVVNSVFGVACLLMGHLLTRLARLRQESIPETEGAPKIPPVLIDSLGQLPPKRLRMTGLMFIASAILVAVFAFIRLGRVIIFHWDPVADGLVAGGIGLTVFVALVVSGNLLWQVGRILEQNDQSKRIHQTR